MFSEQFYSEADKLFSRYPRKVNALLPILYLVQKELGYILPKTVPEIASLCEVSESHVQGVITFYTMFHQEKIGKAHLQVCTNLSCWMKGGNELLAQVEETVGAHNGGVSEDGIFSVEEVECIGACGYAPVMIVNETFHEELDSQKLKVILEDTKKQFSQDV